MSVRATESNTTRVSLVILAVIATGAALYWLRGILTPLALAVFLAVMVDGFARVIRMRLPWVSERAALPLAIVLATTLVGTLLNLIENAIQAGGREAHLKVHLYQRGEMLRGIVLAEVLLHPAAEDAGCRGAGRY